MQVDYDEIFLVKRELLTLQMSLVKHKIEHGEFPETLDSLEIWTLPNLALHPWVSIPNWEHSTSGRYSTPYFYFPKGLPEGVSAATANSKNSYKAIAPAIPFVANRNPVPRVYYEFDDNGRYMLKTWGFLLPRGTGYAFRQGTYEPLPMFVLLSNDPVQGENPE